MGDFNGDGKPDLAVVNQPCESCGGLGSVTVLLGKGDGTFQPRVDYTVGPGPFSLTTGDFNGDGKLDLAVAGRGPGGVFGVGVVLWLLASLGFAHAARRWKNALGPAVALLGLGIALVVTGCGGGSNSSPPPAPTGTPAGTYTLTVTGTFMSGSTSVQNNISLSLTVH